MDVKKPLRSPKKGDPAYAKLQSRNEEPNYDLAENQESADDRTYDFAEDSGEVKFKRRSTAPTYQLAQPASDPVSASCFYSGYLSLTTI